MSLTQSINPILVTLLYIPHSQQHHSNVTERLNSRFALEHRYMPGANFSSEDEEHDDTKEGHLLSIAELEQRRRMFNKRRRMRRIARMRRLAELFFTWKSTTSRIKVRRARAVGRLHEWSNDITRGAAGRWLSEWKSLCFTMWYVRCRVNIISHFTKH